MALLNLGRKLILPVGFAAGIGTGIVIQDRNLLESIRGSRSLVQPTQQNPLALQNVQSSALDTRLLDELLNIREEFGRLKSEFSHLTPQMNRSNQVDSYPLEKILEANTLAIENKYNQLIDEQQRILHRNYIAEREAAVLGVEKKYRPVVLKVKELENHLSEQRDALNKEKDARLVWLACQELHEALRNSQPPQPLRDHPSLKLIRKFIDEDKNSLTSIVLASLSDDVINQGVYSEILLSNRFNEFERICKRVALVDENGGGIAKYLLSYLQSFFVFDKEFTSKDEVSGDVLIDPSVWNTFDILSRIKFCLKENNLEQALRYANQLKGQPRVVARDWMDDVRRHLETKQVIDVISTYAKGITIKCT